MHCIHGYSEQKQTLHKGFYGNWYTNGYSRNFGTPISIRGKKTELLYMFYYQQRLNSRVIKINPQPTIYLLRQIIKGVLFSKEFLK